MAFEGCTKLEEITIPKSVTDIGMRAFLGCTALKSVYAKDLEAWCNISFNNWDSNPICNGDVSLYINGELVKNLEIPESITTIKPYVFYKCKTIESVKIHKGVTSMGWNAFASCTALENVYIEDLEAWCKIDFLDSYANPLNYGADLNIGGELVKNLEIPKSVTEIKPYVFNGCKSIVSVTVPEGVISIGEEAFGDCVALTDINIPASVSSLGKEAFYKCTALKTIAIPEGVTEIGTRAFRSCRALVKADLPESVTTIGDEAFWGCIVLSDVSIPKSTTSIGKEAFYNCEALKSLKLPQGLISIGESAFSGCKAVIDVKIPESVASIGNNAFNLCDTVKDVYIGNLEAWCNIDFGNNKSNPMQSGANFYINGKPAKNIEIPETVTKIKPYVFYGCESPVSVTIHEGVTSIGDGAFYGCKRLSGITLPRNITIIGNSTFENCKVMESIIIPPNVTSVGKNAFCGCEALKSVVMVDGVLDVGDSAFKGTGITDVYYIGNQDNWDYITFGSENTPIQNANLHLMGNPIINVKEVVDAPLIEISDPMVNEVSGEPEVKVTVHMLDRLYVGAIVYVTMSNAEGALLRASEEPLVFFGDTELTVSSKDTTTVRVYIWNKDMQPITKVYSKTISA